MIKYEILDRLLLGEADETDDLPDYTRDQVHDFVRNHDINVFTDESLELLSGIFNLSIGPAYEAAAHAKMPNIFERINVTNDEREALSER